jgi:hypothetical protein
MAMQITAPDVGPGGEWIPAGELPTAATGTAIASIIPRGGNFFKGRGEDVI